MDFLFAFLHLCKINTSECVFIVAPKAFNTRLQCKDGMDWLNDPDMFSYLGNTLNTINIAYVIDCGTKDFLQKNYGKFLPDGFLEKLIEIKVKETSI